MTAICVVDDNGRILAERKVPTCPDAIADCLAISAPNLTRVGLETGPLAVWLWNELTSRRLPIICIDARHANAALKMRPVKTDRNDAAGLAQIMRTGWFKEVRIKSRDSYQVRSILVAREMLVRTRVKIENVIRGLLRGSIVRKMACPLKSPLIALVKSIIDGVPDRPRCNPPRAPLPRRGSSAVHEKRRILLGVHVRRRNSW